MGRLPSRVVALGLVSITIAVAGGAIAIGRSPSEPRAVPTASPPVAAEAAPFHALWPEITRSKAEAAQAAADRGEAPDWRLHADATATEFTRRMMGWTSIVLESGGCIRDCNFDENHQGYNLHNGCLVCEAIVVHVDRLVREGDGGIWSITEVVTDVAIDLAPGAVVAAGDEVLTVPESQTELPLADGTPVHSGFFIGGSCNLRNIGPSRYKDGIAEIFVDDFAVNDCTADGDVGGYLFAMRSERSGPFPDPFQAPLAGGKLRLTALAAVPVVFRATPITVEEAPNLDDASELVRRFMRGRVGGRDVDAMLSEAALRTYASPPNSLNLAPAEGVRYRFALHEVVRVTDGEGYSVIVVLFKHHDGERIPVRSVEQLFLQAGFNSEGEQLPLVLRAGGSYFGGYTKNACLHGGVCWGVYLALGPHGDADVQAQADRLRQLGFESYPGAYGVAGPGSADYPGSAFWAVAAGGIGADAGAMEALDVGQDTDAAVVYFTSEESARAFAAQLDPPPVAIVRIVIFGAD